MVCFERNDMTYDTTSSADTGGKNINLLSLAGVHRKAVSSISFYPRHYNHHIHKAYSNSFTLCASASADGTVRLWDITYDMLHAQQNQNTTTYSKNDSHTSNASTSASAGIQNGINAADTINDECNDVDNELNVNDETTSNSMDNKNTNNDPPKSSPSSYPIKPSSQTLKNKNKTSTNVTANLLTPFVTLSGHARGINDVTWSSSTPGILATASDDKTLRLWDISRYHTIYDRIQNFTPIVANYEDCTPSSTFIRQSHPSNHSSSNTNTDATTTTTAQVGIPSSSSSSSVVPSQQSQEPLVEFKGHSNFVFSTRFNPTSGNILVSGSFDETVKLWDVRSGSCISTLPAHSDPVTCVDMNYDGTCIVSSSHDGLIRIWDVCTGECLKTIYAERNPPVSFVKYSPNGKFILSGTLDSTLRLWNVCGNNNITSSSMDTKPRMTTEGFLSTTTSTANKGIMNRLQEYEKLLSNLDNYQNTMNTIMKGGQCAKTFVGGHVNTKYCIFSNFYIPSSTGLCSNTATATSNAQDESEPVSKKPKHSSSSSSSSSLLQHGIITGSEDGNVYIYDLQNRGVKHVLKGGHDDFPVLAVDCYCHDGYDLIASGGMSTKNSVRFWLSS